MAGQAKDPILSDIRSLSVFLAVSESGSMTQAGRHLQMSQPRVSQAIARLEEELGVALFRRETRPLRLTAAGEALRDGGEALVQNVQELCRRVTATDELDASEIKLGLIDSFAATAGPALVRALRRSTERISIWSGISPNLWGDLQDRRLDYMVSSEPMDLPPGGRRWKLMTEPFVLLLPRRLSANITNPTLQGLATSHPFVRYSIRSHIGAQIERALSVRQVAPPASMEFDGTEAVFAMISAGLGWTVTTPLCLVDGRAHIDQLTALPMPGKGFSRTLYLISGSGGRPEVGSRIAQAARDALRDIIRDEIEETFPWASKKMTIRG